MAGSVISKLIIVKLKKKSSAIQALQTLVALVANNPSMKNVVKARSDGKNSGFRRACLPVVAIYRSTHLAKWPAVTSNKHLNIAG